MSTRLSFHACQSTPATIEESLRLCKEIVNKSVVQTIQPRHHYISLLQSSYPGAQRSLFHKIPLEVTA